VSVGYLLGEFEERARAAAGEPDPTFHALAPRFACGERGLGRAVECPRDGRPGCSVVDALPVGARGRATHFLSWAWGYRLSTVVHAIRDWATRTKAEPAATFLWVCFFCNNQFRILEERSQEGSDNLERALAARLTEIGRVLVIFDTWRSAFYLQRAWCVFETFMADKVGADVQIILPSAEARSLESEIRSAGLDSVVSAFGDVDIEKAKATMEVDEVRVKDLIARTSSFDYINQAVKDRLMQWCKDRFSMMISEEVASPVPAPALTDDFPLPQSGGQEPHAGLRVENAKLRVVLAAKDIEIAKLEAEKERLSASAERGRRELADLRDSLAALRREFLSAGSDCPSASHCRELCTRLEQLSEPPKVVSPEPLGEDFELLMDTIESEVVLTAHESTGGYSGHA